MNRIAWSSLEAQKLDKPRTEKTNGMKLEVSLSPYDIPQAARAYYCAEKDRFIVEFRYLTEEVQTPRAIQEHTTVYEGKNSGRLYAIHCDLKAMNIDELDIAINLVKDDFDSPQSQNPRRDKNLKVLEAYGDDVLHRASEQMAFG
tara:strand:- start:99 stop:533 length:435 start_codon:yes stop_codon:yes gene_type:complete